MGFFSGFFGGLMVQAFILAISREASPDFLHTILLLLGLGTAIFLEYKNKKAVNYLLCGLCGLCFFLPQATYVMCFCGGSFVYTAAAFIAPENEIGELNFLGAFTGFMLAFIFY